MEREAELLYLKKQSRELSAAIENNRTIENLLKYKSITERMIYLFNDRILNGNLTTKIIDMAKETIKWKQMTLDSINILIMTHTVKLEPKSRFHMN